MPLWSGSSNEGASSPACFIEPTLPARRDARHDWDDDGYVVPDRRFHDHSRAVPRTGGRASGGAGDTQGARGLGDAAVDLPQARRRPSGHVPVRVRGERALLVALVVHRRRGAERADRRRRARRMAGRDTGRRAIGRRATRGTARDPARAGDRATAGPAAAQRRHGRLPRLRRGAPDRAPARARGRRPAGARNGVSAGHRHRRLRPPRGSDHADRQRRQLERHRRARRRGLRRRRRPPRQDDRGARRARAVDGVRVRPARPRVPPSTHHRRLLRRRAQPRRRDRGRRGVPDRALATLRDGLRRLAAGSVPDAARVQPQSVHVSAAHPRRPRRHRVLDRRVQPGGARHRLRRRRHQPPHRRHPVARRHRGGRHPARRRTCSPTRRRTPSTSCSSTSAATTSVVSAAPAP